jgi:bacillithiol system protein YtxJ
MSFFNSLFGAPPASSLAQLQTVEAVVAVLEESETLPVLLYKHSSACGTSFFSRRELETLAEVYSGPIYEIVVQTARPVSNKISTLFGIRHETPQVIIVRKGQAVYHRSHGSINRDDMARALASAT